MAHLLWNARHVLIRVATFLKAGMKLLRNYGTYLGHCHPLGRAKLFPRWLYSYFLAVDANFRLKLKSRGIKDPEINSGWSYFIAPEEYDKHISRKTAETEVSLLIFPRFDHHAHVFQGYWLRF